MKRFGHPLTILLPQKQYRIGWWSQLAAALYAVSTLLYVNFIGRLMVAEFLAVTGLLTFRANRLIRHMPYLEKICCGYAIFLAGLIVSDVYNETLSKDFLRGWAAIVFGVISTLFLIEQFRKGSRIIYIYLIALPVAAIFFKQGDLGMAGIVENSNYFKVRFVPILVPALSLLANILWKNNGISAIALLFFSGAVFMFFDARSSGAGLIIAAMLSIVQYFNIRPRLPNIVMIILVIGAFAYSGYVYYVNQVLYHGVGGANAQQVALQENPYNPVELLSAGRASIQVAVKAISDRPLQGFGSWAQDKTCEYGMLYSALTGSDEFTNRLGIIPVHSMILASWLWGGVAGFIGLGMVGLSMLRMFWASFWSNSPLAPILNIYFVSGLWAFFFSPLGHIRTSFPFLIALLIAAAYHARFNNEQYTRL